MGGGDLNMKKSWHPLLMKNQERVWLEEEKAKEEKKKLEQLRREIEQERELLELQKMQAAAGGKKREERLDWMYNVPTGGNNDALMEEVEDYLLGKKKGDKFMLTDDKDKVSSRNKDGFIALQNANSVRDTQSKVREDPLLAIKRQEQAQYEALMKNPIKLKELRRSTEGKEKSHRHHLRRDRDTEHRRSHRRRSRSRSRSRSPVDYHRRSTKHERSDRHSNSRYRSRGDRYNGSHSPTSHDDDRKDSKRSLDQARLDRLAAMQANAQTLSAERKSFVERISKEDEETEKRERVARDRASKGYSGDFTAGLKARVYGGDVNLGDRIARGRLSLVNDKISKNCLERLRAHSPFNDPFPLDPKKRRAAVLIALFASRQGGLNVILTLRGANLTSHGGEVSLPGGKMEETDDTIIQTALREANEEIGLPVHDVEYLTTLKPAFSRTKLIVTPVVVYIRDQNLTPRVNPDEVSLVFSCPFDAFLSSKLVRFREGTSNPEVIEHEAMDILWLGHPYRMHHFSGSGIKHPVFGLTANILIEAARIAYGRDPEFEQFTKGQVPAEEFIWQAIHTSDIWKTDKPKL